MMWLYLLIFVIVCGLAGLLYFWPRGGVQHTFSYHAATSRAATLYYTALFIVTLPPLVYWYATWAAPTYHLPTASVWCMGSAAMFQIVAASVPERGSRIAMHRIITGLSVLGMLGMVVLLLIHTYQIGVALCLAIMLAVTYYALVRRDRARYPLVLQVVIYAAFFVAIGLSLR